MNAQEQHEHSEWVVVEVTDGLLNAQIVAEHLHAEGILAIATQEGAGRALGLTVGVLGEGRVLVPAEFEAQARELLDITVEYVDEEESPLS